MLRSSGGRTHARRGRDQLLGEILRGLRDDPARASRSGLATHVHVPYDRLQAYLRELAAHDLVTPDDRPRLTPRGRELLSRYEAYAEALVAAGIEPDPDAW